MDINNLIFNREYLRQGHYFEENLYTEETIKKLNSNFNSNTDNVFIESKFNGIIYPFFDLDNIELLDKFKNNFKNFNYVIFNSTINDNRYWCILDYACDNFNDILKIKNWKQINDINYVLFSKNKKKLLIRGTFRNLNKKPKIIHKQGHFSKNFEDFINTLNFYFNNNGMKFSILKYKDEKIKLMYDRKTKLKKLEKIRNHYNVETNMETNKNERLEKLSKDFRIEKQSFIRRLKNKLNFFNSY